MAFGLVHLLHRCKTIIAASQKNTRASLEHGELLYEPIMVQIHVRGVRLTHAMILERGGGTTRMDIVVMYLWLMTGGVS